MDRKTSQWSSFFHRYREQLQYLFWGVLTTVVNYGAFWLLVEISDGEQILWCNLLTFVIATLFAFFTNKAFVFRSRVWTLRVVGTELFRFTASRLFSFGIEEFGLWIASERLLLQQYRLFGVDGIMIAKILLSFLAVLLNYFFSKLLVFRKTCKEDTQGE